MTSSSPKPPAPQAPAGGGQYADRVYRSVAGVVGGVLLLVVAGWLGGDAIVRGTGHAPWLAMALLLLSVPLIIAFTLRPAVFAGSERIRIRNPFRTIVLPWSAVDSLRSSYSTELFSGGRKYQLWAVPVSLRARKRASRQDSRAKAAGEERQSPFGVPGSPVRRRPVPGAPGGDGTIRAYSDQAMIELRDLSDRHPVPEDPADRPAPAVRWAFELIGPALAGAVVLIILLAIGG